MTQRLAQLPVRDDWLATHDEAAIDPDRPIIDAHHHLFDRPGNRYLVPEFVADLGSGHRVHATIFVQARASYHPNGPELLRPAGETEFASGVARQAASTGGPRLCAAIVGHADLMQAAAVRPLLEAHIEAGEGRFRGVRHILAWDPDERLLNPAYPTFEDMTESTSFRDGFAELAQLGLSFDAWLHFHQIPRLTALARRFPDVPIALDHCGGIVGSGAYATRRDEVFRQWRQSLTELATCPNVTVKIGGLGMALSGFGFELRKKAPSSEDLAEAWRPWVHSCIEAFGSDRAMFESNFPVDKGSYSYRVGWNAFKRLVAEASSDEAHALMFGTAATFYCIKAGADVLRQPKTA